jgi:signal transduction histidine kinase
MPRGARTGAGLGLAIARSIAESHGGTVVLDRSGLSGSTFLVRLPL